MLDEGVNYTVIAAQLGVTEPDAERAFAAALAELAGTLDAPTPGRGVWRWLHRIAAAARLARRMTRR